MDGRFREAPRGAQGCSENLGARESRHILMPFGDHLGTFFAQFRKKIYEFLLPDDTLISRRLYVNILYVVFFNFSSILDAKIDLGGAPARKRR